MENNTLVHHGTKGMRWGIRRFQNKDGSLTPLGEKRRSLGETLHDYKVASKRKKSLAKARAAREEKKKQELKDQKIAAKREKLIKKGKIKTKDMTDDEIKKRTERLEAEKRLKQLENETEVKGFMRRFGSTLAKKVLAPAAIASGEKFLRNSLDKIGEDILADYDKKMAKTDPKKRKEAELQNLKDVYTKLDYQKKIADLKKPPKSIAEEIKELENSIALLNLRDENFQALKRQAQEAEYINKINKAKNGGNGSNESNDDNDN